jgi:VIT1/CCC1 family predicted Fe2+/Mn2+ transporter
VAFLLAGALPLISFVANWIQPGMFDSPFWISAVITLFTFALVGVIKGRYVNQSYWWSALETLVVGAIAALLAYGVGWLLRGLVA